MMIMAITGVIAAILKDSLGDVFLGSIVTYSIFTAWLTTYHRRGEVNYLEYLALVWITLLGLGSYFANSNLGGASNPNTYPLWIVFSICFAVGDIRNLRYQGLSETQRIIRHVWRIGFSLAWAVMALTDKVVKILGGSIEEMVYIVILPVGIILLITCYWTINVLRFSKKREF